MAFDKNKVPPGLLKEIPGKANNTARSARKNALQRRLEGKAADSSEGSSKNTEMPNAKNSRIRIG
jgi:hypothetical protein